METIYFKINIKKTDITLNEIREQGLFFEEISGSLSIDRKQVIEIDECNYKEEVIKIKKKYDDKS